MHVMHDIKSRSSIDAATGRAIRDGVAERLKDALRNQPALPARLRDLLHRLERQDNADRASLHHH